MNLCNLETFKGTEICGNLDGKSDTGDYMKEDEELLDSAVDVGSDVLRDTCKNQGGVEHSAESIIPCIFCSIRGHDELSCWRKLRRCLICGGKNRMATCDRNDWRHRIDRGKLCCPLCNNDHLGRNCHMQ